MLFRILFAPLLLLVRALLHPWRVYRRARAAPRGALVDVTLRGRVREGPSRPRRLWPPRLLLREAQPHEIHVRALHRLIDEVIADARVTGLVITIQDVDGGWASLDALRRALLRIRAANKRLVAWLPHGGGNKELFVASSAGTIVAPPSGDIAFVGTKAEAWFMRRALDKAGIDVDLHARKEFKSAGDRLARDSRSDADRLQTEVIVDAVDAALIAAFVEGRGVTEAQVRGWLDGGPTHAEGARSRGMVDLVAHDDDLPTVLGAQVVPAGPYFARRRRPLPFTLRRPRVIGVVEVHGAIGSSDSPIGQAMGPVAVAERVIADLRAAEHDPRVVAVLLDIDSPGGTVGASDAIEAAARRLASKKPVVARMGDVAASGGYWIAVAAKTIVARPLTITGSIGVVGMRPILARLAERLGLVRDVIARAPFADLDAIGRPPTEAEHAVIAREIDAHYDNFVAHVARARGMTIEEVDTVARGRVWTGTDAASRKLVDRLGGFDEALEILRAELGPSVRVDPEPRVVVGRPPSRRDPSPERARALASMSEMLEFLATVVPGSVRDDLRTLVLLSEALGSRSRVAAIALVAPPS